MLFSAVGMSCDVPKLGGDGSVGLGNIGLGQNVHELSRCGQSLTQMP